MLDIKLGFKIRNIRNSKRTTLQELANITELTTSFISQVERGIVSPSIDSLKRIAHALGVGVGEFFKEDLKEFTFVRKDKAPKTMDNKTKSSYEILVSDLLGVSMKPLIIRLQKGGEARRELLVEEGDAFIMVIEGGIKLVFEKEEFVLSKEDSFYCKGQKRPQKIANAGDKEAVLLWVKCK